MEVNQIIDRALYKAGRYINRNSSTILTYVGALGVVATGVSTAIATKKAIFVVEYEKTCRYNDLDDNGYTTYDGSLSKIDILQVTWKYYIPAVMIGSSTIACIFGANNLNQKKQASLVSAYTLLDQSYRGYKAKVVDLYGEDSNKNIVDAISKDKLQKNPMTPSDGKLLFMDSISGRFFEAAESEVIDAEYRLNRNFALRGSASLKEFYKFLDVDFGDDMPSNFGWDLDSGMCWYGYQWIDFEHRLVNDENNYHYVLDYVFTPTIGDYDFDED